MWEHFVFHFSERHFSPVMFLVSWYPRCSEDRERMLRAITFIMGRCWEQPDGPQLTGRPEESPAGPKSGEQLYSCSPFHPDRH